MVQKISSLELLEITANNLNAFLLTLLHIYGEKLFTPLNYLDLVVSLINNGTYMKRIAKFIQKN